MNCMLKNCKDEFDDTEIGLSTMLWHMLIKHPKEDVNGKKLSSEERMCLTT